MLKKLACIGLSLMITITLSGCGKENKIKEYNKESNANIVNTETDNIEKVSSEEDNKEIIILCSGWPVLDSVYYNIDNEVKAGEDLTKYEIEYVNYNSNIDSPYLSTGKVEKFYDEYCDKECFSVENVGRVAVSSNVKPIEVKLEQIAEIPEKVFSLNSDLENYNIFKLYSIQLKSNGDKNYILEANYRKESESRSQGKIVVLDSKYKPLATLVNTTWSNCYLCEQQIANLDFDDDLEIIAFNQGIDFGGGIRIGVFDFLGDNLIGDTMSDLGA